MNKNANGTKNETLNIIFSFGSGDWHKKKLMYFEDNKEEELSSIFSEDTERVEQILIKGLGGLR